MKGIAIAKKDMMDPEEGTAATFLSCFPDFRDDTRRTVSLQCDKEVNAPWAGAYSRPLFSST